jgi:hypothetical protein
VSIGTSRPRKKRKGKAPKSTAEIIEKDFSDSDDESRANLNNNSARDENSRDSFFDHLKKKKNKKDTVKSEKMLEEEDTRDSVDLKKKKKKVGKVRENATGESS